MANQENEGVRVVARTATKRVSLSRSASEGSKNRCPRICLHTLLLYSIAGVGCTTLLSLSGLWIIRSGQQEQHEFEEDRRDWSRVSFLASYALGMQILGAYGLNRVWCLIFPISNSTRSRNAAESHQGSQRICYQENVSQDELKQHEKEEQFLEAMLLLHMLGSFPLVLSLYGAIFLKVACYEWWMGGSNPAFVSVDLDTAMASEIVFVLGRGGGPTPFWLLPFAASFLCFRCQRIWRSGFRTSFVDSNAGGEFPLLMKLPSRDRHKEVEEEEKKDDGITHSSCGRPDVSSFV